jgi:hypothetical protein
LKKLRVSSESDPVQCSVGGGGDGVVDQIPDGFTLEVVLHQEGVSEPQNLPGASVDIPVVLGGSGLRSQQGKVLLLDGVSPSSGGASSNRDENHAHHVNYIFEDVGMHFSGDKEGNVNRILEFEDRDRGEFSAWEQRNNCQ